MNRVSVATFNEVEPALSLERLLEAADCPTMIHDESKLERFWFMSEPFAAIHVEVDENVYLKARRIFESSSESRVAIHCPDCQSSRVEFPQVSRKFIMPGFSSILMAMHFIPREFYCLDCHHTWPKLVALEPHRDILGWPSASRFWHPRKKPDETPLS